MIPPLDPGGETVGGSKTADSDAGRTGALFDELDVGVVSVESDRDHAHVNAAAAALLSIPAGDTTATAFAGVVRALARRALNQTDVARALRQLEHDPAAEFKTTWRFREAPTHLGVVSKPAARTGFNGRLWAFYDNSALAQAIEVSSRATALLRTTSDAMIEPQALLEAVWGDGQIVDFVYRDVNRATCEYLGMDREELIGSTLVDTMPNVRPSGLLERFARCATTREPLILDDLRYDNQILTGPRRYDIRAAHVRGDFITLNWRDVTERSELAQCIASSEERFRLLAENTADVVVRLSDDGQVTWVSNSVESALGAPPEFWIGRNAIEFAPPEDLAAARERLDKVIRRDADIGRASILGADGVEHRIHLHSKPFYAADGTRDGIVASFRIIDDEVAAEHRALRQIAQRDAQNRSLTRLLQAQTNRLMSELNSAADYVASILPGDLDGPVLVSSRYVSARELGGDSYDYRWIDDDHLIVYLVDVSGHGVEPAMVSVSVHNTLRSGTLPPEVLREPDEALRELNRLFQMDRHGGHFFTVWYGVYQASTRTLRFASAGHPPALVLTSGDGAMAAVELSTRAIPIGIFEDTDFDVASHVVPAGAEILLYSDGAFELNLPDGRWWSLPEFIGLCRRLAGSADWSLDGLIAELRAIATSGLFEDDCTLVRLSIP